MTTPPGEYVVVVAGGEPMYLWRVRHAQPERAFGDEWQEALAALIARSGDDWDIPQLRAIMEDRGWQIETTRGWNVVEDTLL